MSNSDSHQGLIQRLASRLRFPQLFFVVASLFLIDLAIPDFIPFVDEILLGALTVMLGMLRQRRDQREPEMKNVTPRE